MGSRGFCFHCGFVARHYLRDLPAIVLSLPVQRMYPYELLHGIRVTDPTAQTRGRFTELIGQALGLIAESDPVRFQRVQTQIRIIVNTTGINGSAYGPACRVCMLNLRCYGCKSDPGEGVRLLASSFVHDATFGYLIYRGIFRTNRNYDHFDRLCCREARQFMRRLGLSKTPWDSEHLSRVPVWDAITTGFQDLLAAEKDAVSK